MERSSPSPNLAPAESIIPRDSLERAAEGVANLRSIRGDGDSTRGEPGILRGGTGSGLETPRLGPTDGRAHRIEGEQGRIGDAQASKASLKKTVVCVAYYFPPVLVPGSHRTRAVVRHLPGHGWRPVVVTSREASDDYCDDSLLEGLPSDLVVYRPPDPRLLDLGGSIRSRMRRLFRTGRNRADQGGSGSASAVADGPSSGGWLDWGSRWLQTPDLAVGWLPAGLVATLDAIYRHRGQALYSSAPHWTAHLIAMLAKRISGRPWIADFRDPWRSNPFRRLPYPSVDRFDAWLESQVVSRADRVICNSNYVQADFESRFPHLAGRFVTIPNGFEPEDFAGLAASRPIGTDQLVLTHAGYFHGPRRPHAIFEAVRSLRDRAETRRPPRLQLIGTPTYEGRCLKSIAGEFGVEDGVDVLGEVPHRQALEFMNGSDIQLLVGFSGGGSEFQVPSKLFEYLGIGRPILALAPRHGAICDVVMRGGVPGEVCDPDDPRGIADAIVRLESRACGPNLPRESANSLYHRREQVAQIARLIDEACRRPGGDLP